METEIHLKVASHSGFSPRFAFALPAALLALLAHMHGAAAAGWRRWCLLAAGRLA